MEGRTQRRAGPHAVKPSTAGSVRVINSSLKQIAAFSPRSARPAMNTDTEAVSSSPVFLDKPCCFKWEQPEPELLARCLPSSTRETESCSPPVGSSLAPTSPRRAEPAGAAPGRWCWGRAARQSSDLRGGWAARLGAWPAGQRHSSSSAFSFMSRLGRDAGSGSPLPRSLLPLHSRG